MIIPSSVMSIGDRALGYCDNLNEVHILSSFLDIEEYFYYTKNIEYIYAHKPVINQYGDGGEWADG